MATSQPGDEKAKAEDRPEEEPVADPIEDGLRVLFESDVTRPLPALSEFSWSEEGLGPGYVPDRPSVLGRLRDSVGPLSEIHLRAVSDERTPEDKKPKRSTEAGRQTGAEALAARAEAEGRYEVLGEIGRGGVGVVYKARDNDLGRDLALKVLHARHPQDSSAIARFVEEAQIGGQLQHPGIVPVHEIGLLAGETPYFTMKLVKGQTLSTLLDQRTNVDEDRQRFLNFFEQVSRTVAYAHARGVIHRDLKPSNVMIGPFGEVQVVDWGLAKVLQEGGIYDERRKRKNGGRTQVTEVHTVRSDSDGSDSLEGSVLGTPAYMPPEQARGDVDDLDERSDVFGLGAILCEILTGLPPYTGENIRDVHDQAKEGRLDDALSRLDASSADVEIVALARRCLSPESRDRPADASGVAKVMRDYFDSMDEKQRAAEVEATEARARVEAEKKARWLTVAIAVIILAAVGISGGVLLKLESDKAARSRTATSLAEAAIAHGVNLRGEARVKNVGSAPAKWREAVSAFERAAALASVDGVQEKVRGRAVQFLAEARQSADATTEAAVVVRRDRGMVERLERIRLTRGEGFLAEVELTKTTSSGEEISKSANEQAQQRKRRDEVRVNAYRDAFRDYLDALDVDWNAADTDRRATVLAKVAIQQELARALDHWALAARKVAVGRPEKTTDTEKWTGLLRLAKKLDPDPLRIRIRDAIEGGKVDALKRITSDLPIRVYGQPGERPPSKATGTQRKEPEVADSDMAPPATYDLLASGLLDAGAKQEALSILRQAHIYHPGDFWIHHGLGTLAVTWRAVHPLGSQHFSAALALRPMSAQAWRDLAAAGLLCEPIDSALFCLKRAAALSAGDADLAPLHAEATLWLARLCARTGDVDKSIASYRNLLALRPSNLDAHLELARVLRRAGDLSGAVEAFRYVGRARGDDAQVYLELGRLLLKQGSALDALGPLSLGAELAPGDPELQLQLGIAHLRSGKTQDARKSLETAAALRPGDARIHLQLAIRAGRSGEIEKAVDALREAIRLGPDLAVVRLKSTAMWKAPMKTAREDLESVRSILQTALRKRPNDSEIHALLGALSLRTGERLEKAIPSLEKALALNPQNRLAQDTLALTLLRQARPADALEVLDARLEAGGADRAARNNRAVALHSLGRMQEAMAELHIAVKLEPEEPVACLNLGLLLLEMKSPAEAETFFRRAAKADDELAEAPFRIAETLLQRSHAKPLHYFQRALPIFRRALALDPRHAGVLRDLGRTLGYLVHGEGALKHLEESIELDRHDATAHTALGVLLHSRGANKKAVAALERAITLDKADWRPVFNLGRVRIAQGDYGAGLDNFREALRLDPRNRDVLRSIFDLLSRNDADLASATARLAQTLEEVIEKHEGPDSRTTELFLEAWCRAPKSLDAKRPLEIAARRVTETQRQDTRWMALLARVQRAAKNVREAILTLEEAAVLEQVSPDSLKIETLLKEYRDAVLPRLLTCASVDAILERGEELVAADATWHYWPGTAEPSPALEWTRIDFDDRDWKEGSGGFGYREGGLEDGTLLEDMPGFYTTLYVRKTFQLSAPERYERLLVSVEADDGFVAYLNGREIGRARAGEPGARLPVDATADAAAPEPLEATRIELPRALLLPGENCLALEGLNRFSEDVDFFLRPTLLGVPTVAHDAERFDAVRKVKAEKPPVCSVYLEGRLLQRAGEFGEAAEKFRAALTVDPEGPLLLRRLAETVRDCGELEAIFKSNREALLSRKLPPRLLGRNPETPVNLSPEREATTEETSVVLRASPYFSYDTRLLHVKSHWQARAAGASYALNPTFDTITSEALISVALPVGLLLSDTTYFFRVSYWSADGKKSAFSEETSFVTGDLALEAVPFDLSAHFNRDVVAVEGDGDDDYFDAVKSRLVVDGYRPAGSIDKPARGVPRNRAIGVHRLGDYTAENCLQLLPSDTAPVRIAVAPDRYVALRFLIANGQKSAMIQLRLEFKDGTSAIERLPSPDWYSDPEEGKTEQTPIWNGMDRLRQETLQHDRDPALFEVLIETDRTRELVAIVFLPEQSTFQRPTGQFQGKFHLFAITGMRRKGGSE